ncbi:MAG: DUF6941 family protein [Acidobacteriaceae bacterium]|jgi:hypothetical protein
MRPHLNLATICERYILEADGSLTLFRIIDRFNVGGTTPEMPVTPISFNLIVNFRSGEFLGPLDLAINIVSPLLSAVQELRIPVNFEAPAERAVLSIGQVNLTLNEPGLYWIIVKLAEEEYTRVPLRIVYQRQPTVQTGA